MTKTQSATGLSQVKIDLIYPSPDNPRRSIDPDSLAELAQSIEAVGIQVPLLLRAVPTGFQIVGGERRYRAALLAGLTEVPAIVREFTDAEAREAQLIDNLQRADLSPIEEAQAYEFLIESAEKDGFAISDHAIARKVGKPLGYVRSRRKLLDLIPGARTALAERMITFGVALLIAKLLPADQEKATVYALNASGGTVDEAIEGVREEWKEIEEERAENAKLDPDEQWTVNPWEPVSEARVRDFISDRILLDLSKAPWPLDATNLHPDAGACFDCSKRSGVDQALFAELTAKSDACTDPACFAVKKSTFVHIVTARAQESGVPLLTLKGSASYMAVARDAKSYSRGQWLAAKPGECEYVRPGLLEGELLNVCVEQKCKVHAHTVVNQSANSSSNFSQNKWAVEQKKLEEKRMAFVQTETPIRAAVIAEVVQKLRGIPFQRSVLRELLRVSQLEEKQRAESARLIATSKLTDFEPLAVALLTAKYAKPLKYDADRKNHRDELWDLAKAAGVNADAIAARLTAPEKKTSTKPASKAAVKPAVAKKAAAKKAPAKKKALRRESKR